MPSTAYAHFCQELDELGIPHTALSTTNQVLTFTTQQAVGGSSPRVERFRVHAAHYVFDQVRDLRERYPWLDAVHIYSVERTETGTWLLHGVLVPDLEGILFQPLDQLEVAYGLEHLTS